MEGESITRSLESQGRTDLNSSQGRACPESLKVFRDRFRFISVLHDTDKFKWHA
jgi:hypothetical protein